MEKIFRRFWIGQRVTASFGGRGTVVALAVCQGRPFCYVHFRVSPKPHLCDENELDAGWF